MRITTWNVNGVRSIDVADTLRRTTADIVCIQETKVTRDKLTSEIGNVRGWNAYFAFHKRRLGYSGVATYCRNSVTPFAAADALAHTYAVNLFGPSVSNDDDNLSSDVDQEGRCVITLHEFDRQNDTTDESAPGLSSKASAPGTRNRFSEKSLGPSSVPGASAKNDLEEDVVDLVKACSATNPVVSLDRCNQDDDSFPTLCTKACPSTNIPESIEESVHSLTSGANLPPRGTLAVVNVYCPRVDADAPDPDRLAYKRRFCEALAARVRALRRDRGYSVALVGDLNVAHRGIDHCEAALDPAFDDNEFRRWLSDLLSDVNCDDDGGDGDGDSDGDDGGDVDGDGDGCVDDDNDDDDDRRCRPTQPGFDCKLMGQERRRLCDAGSSVDTRLLQPTISSSNRTDETSVRSVGVGETSTSVELMDHGETHSDQLRQSNRRPEFVDAFRYLHPRQREAYTCWNTQTNARARNYGTRIDYIILSADLATSPHLHTCSLLTSTPGSDHCPVTATLRGIALCPAPKAPPLCAKYLPEIRGNQQSLRNYLVNKSKEQEDGRGPKSSARNSATAKRSAGKITLDTFMVVEKRSRKNESGSSSVESNNFSTYVGRENGRLCEISCSSSGSSGGGSSASSSQGSEASIAKDWKQLFSGASKRAALAPPPKCTAHGLPCSLRTVKKEGANKGRQFYSCAYVQSTVVSTGGDDGYGDRGDRKNNFRCDFFKWAA